MCTRTVLTPDGDIFQTSWREIKALRKAGSEVWILDDATKMSAFQDSISRRFHIDKWNDEPFISANICPTDFGLMILLEDGKRVVREGRFGFKRQWGAGHNFRFDNLLPETDEFRNLGLPTYNVARTDPKKINRIWMNKSGNRQFFPAFSEKHFCLILIRGFIEFGSEKREIQLKTKKSTKDFSIPYITEHVGEKVIVAAGLWEKNEAGEYQYSFGTSEPNDLMRKIDHDRCPVICLSDEQQNMWLDPETSIDERIRFGLKPAPSDQFRSWRVSEAMNKPTNKDPKLVLIREKGFDEAVVAA